MIRVINGCAPRFMCKALTDHGSWTPAPSSEFKPSARRSKIWMPSFILIRMRTTSWASMISGDSARRAPARIPIYASKETMHGLEKSFAYAFNGTARFPGYLLPEPHLIDGPFLLGDTEIHPIPVEHGRAHVLGFLFRQEGRSVVAYLSDCKRVDPDGIKILEGVETLILGTPCRRPHPTHMNMVEGLALAQRLGPRQTYFTHLSHDFGHTATQQELPENAFLAYDGLRLEL